MKSIYTKLIIAFLPTIGLYFWGMNILSNDTQILGFMAYYYLMGVLLITPLAYLLTQIQRLKKYSNSIIAYRRPVGIIAGILPLLHMLKFDQKVYEIWEKYFLEKQSFLSFIIDSITTPQSGAILGMPLLSFWAGIIGIVLMFLLLITSNNISQKILGLTIWKWLQKCVYPLFIIVVIHIYFIGGWKGVYLYPAIFLVVLRFYSWFSKNFHYVGRKKISQSGYRRFLCPPCGFIYDEELGDPDGGLAPGTKYEEIPDDWVCPVCGAAKKDFIPLDGHYNPSEGEDHELRFKVVSKKFVTQDVIELQLLCERTLEILPGQFCNLIFDSKEGKQMRSYSVSQHRDNILTFLIKLKSGGVGGEHLKNIGENQEILGIGPFGNFILQNTSSKKIFIATGTGLSPIYYMMHMSWEAEKVLYFGLRKQEDIFYLDELKKIPNLTVYIYLSQDETSVHNYGRISYDQIKYTNNDEIYMCGSPGLIENLQKEFQLAKKENVFFEKFL